jgi:hypothetical protein
MHEFNKFITQDISELIEFINKRQGRKQIGQSKKSKRLIYLQGKHISLYKKLTHEPGKKLNQLPPIIRTLAINSLEAAKAIKKILLKTPSRDPTKSSIRIFYVRYTADWILFTNTNKSLTKYIKNKISSYLKHYLRLTLSDKKTKITNLFKEPARFLGFSIKSRAKSKIRVTHKGALKRTTGQFKTIGYDTTRVISLLQWRGFLKKGKPREQPAWSILTDYEIITKYNAIIRGMVNYYLPIINYRSTLNYLIYIFEYSCYKTLC